MPLYYARMYYAVTADIAIRQAMNNFSIEITQACLLAASCSIPSTGWSDTRSKKVHGWTELVEPHRDKSLFWHDL